MDGIVENIEKGLAQLEDIAPNGKGAVHADVEPLSTGIRDRLDATHSIAGDIVQLERLQCHAARADLIPGKDHQIAYQAAKLVRFLHRFTNNALVLLGRARAEKGDLEIALQGGQGVRNSCDAPAVNRRCRSITSLIGSSVRPARK